MKHYWDTLRLIGEFDFTKDELIQLLAVDLCKIDSEDIRRYLEDARHMFSTFELDPKSMVKEMTKMTDVPFD